MRKAVKVVIDLQFYNLMTEKEQGSLVKQLAYCHSVNRNSTIPFNFIISSAVKESPLNEQLNKFNAFNWGISIKE